MYWGHIHIKQLREKLKLREIVGTELQQNQRTLQINTDPFLYKSTYTVVKLLKIQTISELKEMS